MKLRVTIQWTETARKSLKQLPPKVRRGIISKIDELYECDPRQVGKPLAGPLQGFRSLEYSRYRVIIHTETETIANGKESVHVKVQVVVAGLRKERDKHDVYQVAKKLVELGVIPVHDAEGDAPS